MIPADALAPMIHAHQPAIVRRIGAANRDIDALVSGVWGDLVRVLETAPRRPMADTRSDVIVHSRRLHRLPAIIIDHATAAGNEAQAVAVENMTRHAGAVLTEAKKFAKPSPTRARELVMAPGWESRMARLTSLANPADLAAAITAGVAKGETPVQLAKRIRPIVQNVGSAARRVARTAGVMVARQIEFENYEKLGPELVVGYQIHSALVELTRPEHRRRHLTQYFRDPRPGEKSMARDMPHPPLEANGDIAFNCLCYLTPIMDDGTRPPPIPSAALASV